jgi:excisionase family DNA binding protein
VSTVREDFLTVADIAALLKLNQQTVRNWIDAGTLPALRVGRRVRVRRADFDALVERGRTVPPRPVDGSQALAFWEGDLHPTPVLILGDAD